MAALTGPGWLGCGQLFGGARLSQEDGRRAGGTDALHIPRGGDQEMASQLPPEEWPVTRPATGSCLPWATLWGQEGQRDASCWLRRLCCPCTQRSWLAPLPRSRDVRASRKPGSASECLFLPPRTAGPPGLGPDAPRDLAQAPRRGRCHVSGSEPKSLNGESRAHSGGSSPRPWSEGLDGRPGVLSVLVLSVHTRPPARSWTSVGSC